MKYFTKKEINMRIYGKIPDKWTLHEKVPPMSGATITSLRLHFVYCVLEKRGGDTRVAFLEPHKTITAALFSHFFPFLHHLSHFSVRKLPNPSLMI